MKASTQSEGYDSLTLELRRGAIVLAVLSQLCEEQYGYSLKRSLTDKGFEIDEGTLYPLLRRLEAQGLLKSRWRVEDARPRRYYRLNAQGESLLTSLGKEWAQLARMMERLLK